ncbi:hypothetical protein [Georgenia sp. MJ170]|uniref:hypothetical protein n=1 Tax=Georgenia sunbinii TaxID=3117728 RepID=UPI002F261D34
MTALNLPAAEHETPSCGACGSSTRYEDADFTCDDCGLVFDGETLKASYLDPDAQTCGAACSNEWHHSPGAIRPGWAFRCGTCVLPVDHVPGPFGHYHGCEPFEVGEGE